VPHSRNHILPLGKKHPVSLDRLFRTVRNVTDSPNRVSVIRKAFGERDLTVTVVHSWGKSKEIAIPSAHCDFHVQARVQGLRNTLNSGLKKLRQCDFFSQRVPNRRQEFTVIRRFLEESDCSRF
jgi:hypothetical protein